MAQTNRSKQPVRETFRTSCTMDFFTLKKLVTQTGHPVEEFPFVAVKELVDNALDATEEADISPVIEITADAAGIAVKDNGPGLPESTLQGQLDFNVRTSNREAYVAPDRGAQGNALKTLLPMPTAIDPEGGKFIVETHGVRHVITCRADPISQQPVIRDDRADLQKSKNRHSGDGRQSKLNGTLIRLEWTPRTDSDDDVIWPFEELLPLCGASFSDRFRALVAGFAVFNPHATITLDWFGEKTVWEATNPDWPKWRPCQSTSSHWYEQDHLERLIGACITLDRERGEDRLVSDFISTFDGLSGSKKRSCVLADADLHRVKLSGLVAGETLDYSRIAHLLAAMQRHTRPVNSKRLGLIGEEHLRKQLLAMGVQPKSFRYSCLTADSKSKKRGAPAAAQSKLNPMPWVVESAFGWKGDDSPDQRNIFAGVNWSPGINNPFRTFGDTGEGLETLLADMRATRDEPIVFVLHLAHPRVEYTDQGKSALVIRSRS